ncbi:hypothetical protein P12x_001429 [Tundrisphaera lichenicola]|uniref:hypothetical protein n=1 Tax=Tundrisphaera lichenicola TaxID=2029860 RepID=UPI003EC0616D
MATSKKASLTSAVTRLNRALKAWKPPGNIQWTIIEEAQVVEGLPRKVRGAVISLMTKQVTRTFDERLERDRSLKLAIDVEAGHDSRGLARRLKAVAEGIWEDQVHPSSIASGQGFVMLGWEVKESTTPRIVPRVRSDVAPIGYDPEAPGIRFRSVPGWPYYDVSRCGVVRSYRDNASRTIAQTARRILQPQEATDCDGPTVTLSRGVSGTENYRKITYTLSDLVKRAWSARGPSESGPRVTCFDEDEAERAARLERHVEVLRASKKLSRKGGEVGQTQYRSRKRLVRPQPVASTPDLGVHHRDPWIDDDCY